MKILAVLISLLMLASTKHQARHVEIVNGDTQDIVVFAQTFKDDGYPNYLIESCGRVPAYHEYAWIGHECFNDDEYVLLKLKRINKDGSYGSAELELLHPNESKSIVIKKKN